MELNPVFFLNNYGPEALQDFRLKGEDQSRRDARDGNAQSVLWKE